MRIATRMPKTMASLKRPTCTARVCQAQGSTATAYSSISPMTMPPSIAPGTLPIPPSTAATKAFSPGNTPMSGSIFG